ncbi:MAG: ATP synthase F0 subunit B [Microgenomates group bacterium]|jgi:F-type H+-transporting ATPase subunit b|nr:ATP synthase F0 subunit B [Candidatus Woesebacteria bacterium]QQR64371.1 MAG: ATP synthase F0 subunit B [Candidatus Roizmanbacteria bacterium]
MENLGIDSKLLIAQLINFGLFFFVFKKYLSKPFLKFIKSEKEGSEEREKLLLKAKSMDEKMVEKEKALLATMKKQSDAQIQEAKNAAAKIKVQLLEEAEKEINELKVRAKKQLVQEQTEMQKDAKQKINELSFMIVNSVLKEVLTTEMKKKISDSIISNSAKSVTFDEN